MLQAQQDELLLADGLALLDEHLAAGVGVVMVGDARPRLLAEPGGGLGLEGERRRAVELVGDQAEEDLADPRRGERRAEFLVDRPVGLDDPLGDDPLARDQRGPGPAARPSGGSTGSGSIPRWAAGCPAPRTPSRTSGRNAAAICACRVSRRSGVSVAALSSTKTSGRSFQVVRTVSRRSSNRAALAIGHGQVVEALGQLADRRRIVDHHRRHLVGGGLALVAGLGLVADLEFLDVDPQLASLNPVLRIGSQLSEAWRAHNPDAQQWKQRALELFDLVSLPTDQAFFQRYPRQLSVGQAQRVLIAMATLHRPRLLIADEATSALDAVTQSETLELFRKLNRELGMAMLFISHDLLAVASLCSRIAILRQGRIAESGPTAEMFHSPRTEDTRALLQAVLRNTAAAADIMPDDNVAHALSVSRSHSWER